MNVLTGDLTVIIDDWSLYYMYDVAFDGTYFYIDEWSLNRYTLNGQKDSDIFFPFNVRGSAWDGTYYWTLLDTGEIKCWDISEWPVIAENTQNNFFPPTSACRGLWFDGTYFWTAESIEGAAGYIYQFDYTGAVIDQILEPQARGYAACLITLPNDPPETPATPEGPTQGDPQESYVFYTSTTDPQDHDLYYQWDWGDGEPSSWYGPYPSGVVVSHSHKWQQSGAYEITVRAKDIYGSQSTWSEPHTIIIGNHPPTPPTIEGTPHGKPGVLYLYRFSCIDPDGDLIFYYIDWGDDSPSEWSGPYASGAELTIGHQWQEKGIYLIQAKAKDSYGSEGDWGSLEVTIPTKNPTVLLLQIILERLLRFLPLFPPWMTE